MIRMNEFVYCLWQLPLSHGQAHLLVQSALLILHSWAPYHSQPGRSGRDEIIHSLLVGQMKFHLRFLAHVDCRL